MAKAETGTSRAPRGTKPVSAAFFSALDAMPEAQRAAVARAAQVMIRDELRLRREKVKTASDKARANGKAHPAKAAPARKTAAPAASSPPNRSARKNAPGPDKTAAAKASPTKALTAKTVASAGDRADPQPQAAAGKPRRAAKPVAAAE